MKPQIIKTNGGEELVVLSRREYDALLAQLGDEEAEDSMTLLLAEEARQRVASGKETLLAPRSLPADLDRDHSAAAGAEGKEPEPNSSGK